MTSRSAFSPFSPPKTTTPDPSLSLILSPSSRMTFGSLPSTLEVTTFMPSTSRAESMSDWMSSPPPFTFNSSISRVRALMRAVNAWTLASTSPCGHFSASAMRWSLSSWACTCSTAYLPVTASMRLIPDATLVSLTILKRPIEPVRSMCVPPQSSILTPGISTTLTRSPYFSPNRAIAPSSLASSKEVTCVFRGRFRLICSFTTASILCNSFRVGREK